MKTRYATARRQVIDELATYKAAPSDEALESLKSALDVWQDSVEAWARSEGASWSDIAWGTRTAR